MEIGYSYHIKDSFFQRFQDPKLMSNKEAGGYRPHYVCIQDPSTIGLYWAIPLSSKVQKYRIIMEKKISRYGSCDTIVIGGFAGREGVFLLQNAIPITEQYIDHIHEVSGTPVGIHKNLQEVLGSKLNKLLALERNGHSWFFPDVAVIRDALIQDLTQ